jgi:hypothetical protein
MRDEDATGRLQQMCAMHDFDQTPGPSRGSKINTISSISCSKKFFGSQPPVCNSYRNPKQVPPIFKSLFADGKSRRTEKCQQIFPSSSQMMLLLAIANTYSSLADGIVVAQLLSIKSGGN